MAWQRLANHWALLKPPLALLFWLFQLDVPSNGRYKPIAPTRKELTLTGAVLEKAFRRPSEMSFSLNFTLPAKANTTSSPVVTGGKEARCGPSVGLAAGIPSLVATALLVALLFTLIQRRRRSNESIEEHDKPCEISDIFDNPKISENPQRTPPHDNIVGTEEGHIYVKTVARSEEPTDAAYRRPPVEVERRRGLWWLIPRLSLD